MSGYGNLIAAGIGLRRRGDSDTEVLAHGWLCEGWGISAGDVSGYANADSSCGGTSGLTLESFSMTSTPAGTRAVSVTRMGNALRVTHDFGPSADANLYRVDVRVERLPGYGLSGYTDTPIKYRRTFDWDVAPTQFNEFVTWAKRSDHADRFVTYTSDNGFARSDPLSGPTYLAASGWFDRDGLSDHGGLIDLNLGHLGMLDPPVEFTLYYGVTTGEAAAKASVAAVDAHAYSLGIASSTPETTAVFAVDGTSLPVGESSASLPATPVKDRRAKAPRQQKPGRW